LAKEVKLPFINFKTENIYSPWLGESGQRMKTAIKIAEKMSPAVVFIDEIDRFGRRAATSDSAGEETRRVFSQLLEWLGSPDRKAIIVGTTNKPKDLDPAFIRTGRFDYKIPVLYPDERARLEILRIHLGLPDEQGKKPPKLKPPLALPDKEFLDFLWKEIVPRTDNYSGAELEELVTRAKRNAFERGAKAIGKEDFYQSLKTFRINREEREHEKRYYEELAREYTDDVTFLKRQLD
jgi:transitional endoplasmic reticulum ATPase